MVHLWRSRLRADGRSDLQVSKTECRIICTDHLPLIFHPLVGKQTRGRGDFKFRLNCVKDRAQSAAQQHEVIFRDGRKCLFSEVRKVVFLSRIEVVATPAGVRDVEEFPDHGISQVL